MKKVSSVYGNPTRNDLWRDSEKRYCMPGKVFRICETPLNQLLGCDPPPLSPIKRRKLEEILHQ